MKMDETQDEQPDIKELEDYYLWHQGSGLKLKSYADFAATPDVLIAISKVFFPDFIEYKGAVIMGWRFSHENFDMWYSKFDGNIREIEVMLNTIEILGELFPNAMQSQNYHNIKYLGMKLAFSWECELRRQFPSKLFKVIGEKSSQGDDFILSFWQI